MSDSPNGKLPLYKVGETVHPFINGTLENPAKITDVTLHDLPFGPLDTVG